MTNISRTELCQWLRDNSSGVYRHAADAADEIEMLVQFANRYFAQAMANGEEVSRLREENERLRNDAERYRWLRESVKKSGGITKAQSYFWNYGGSRKRLDAAIDAARGAK